MMEMNHRSEIILKHNIVNELEIQQFLQGFIRAETQISDEDIVKQSIIVNVLDFSPNSLDICIFAMNAYIQK